MAVASRGGDAWQMRVEPVGDAAELIPRLLSEADGAAVALGIDCPIGLPHAYARRYADGAPDFPAFLCRLAARPEWLRVAATLAEAGPDRPFYPARPASGMTRAAHAAALGLPDAQALSRACDRATADRPAGAPIFWTLGANQSGKAAIHAWQKMLIPALIGTSAVRLWPFAGRFRSLLKPGAVAVAECYPAEAMRLLGVRPIGSKRRQADRWQLAPAIRQAMARLAVVPGPDLALHLETGFGTDAAGEDRLDCVLGALCTLAVVESQLSDAAPADAAIQRWEGWVLGQTSLPRRPS